MIPCPPSDDSSLVDHLADLLDVDPDAPEPWTEDDLAAMWRHLLDTPLAVELDRIPSVMEQIRAWEKQTGFSEPTFRDLLHHEHPSIELLKAVTQFGKSVCQWERGFPPEIAKAVYFVAITVAQARCGESISSLDSASRTAGIAWSCSRSWIDRQSARSCSIRSA